MNDATRLPGVVGGTSYRTPALFARKTLLARLKEDGETVALRVALDDRDVLLEADPRAFFLTDHYRGYPWVLVRLREARLPAVMELLERAWEQAAPQRPVSGGSRGGMRSVRRGGHGARATAATPGLRRKRG